MSKLNGLSGLEQEVYFKASEAMHRIVTHETILSWGIAGKGVINVILSNMCKKGWLIRLKRGVYMVGGPKGGLEDVFYAAQTIFDGYLGFSTALNLHGLMDELPFTVYVVTVKVSGSRRLGSHEIKAVALGKRALGIERKGDYWISSVPKTIYDSLYLPEYGGGYPLALKAIHLAKMDEAGWGEFLSYVEKFESDASCQKTGYLLELLSRKTGTPVPDSVIERLGKSVRSVVYLGKGKGGVYDKKWKLVDCIGEGRLLSWWHGG